MPGEFCVFLVDMGFHRVSQDGLDLLTSSTTPIYAFELFKDAELFFTNVFFTIVMKADWGAGWDRVSLCNLGWSAVVQSWLTATSASWVQAQGPPQQQPPECWPLPPPQPLEPPPQQPEPPEGWLQQSELWGLASLCGSPFSGTQGTLTEVTSSTGSFGIQETGIFRRRSHAVAGVTLWPGAFLPAPSGLPGAEVRDGRDGLAGPIPQENSNWSA
ncbi:hypothetical protein AAY473_038622 [Plecturocebus cupreus]